MEKVQRNEKKKNPSFGRGSRPGRRGVGAGAAGPDAGDAARVLLGARLPGQRGAGTLRQTAAAAAVAARRARPAGRRRLLPARHRRRAHLAAPRRPHGRRLRNKNKKKKKKNNNNKTR